MSNLMIKKDTQQVKVIELVGQKLDPKAKYLFVLNQNAMLEESVHWLLQDLDQLLGREKYALTLTNGPVNESLKVYEVMPDTQGRKKRDCAFQYAVATPFKLVEDKTKLTLDEAKELWSQYKPDFIEKLQNEQDPEMAIWINMKEEFDYRETLAHVTKDTETDGKRLYERIEIRV